MLEHGAENALAGGDGVAADEVRLRAAVVEREGGAILGEQKSGAGMGVERGGGHVKRRAHADFDLAQGVAEPGRFLGWLLGRRRVACARQSVALGARLKFAFGREAGGERVRSTEKAIQSAGKGGAKIVPKALQTGGAGRASGGHASRPVFLLS